MKRTTSVEDLKAEVARLKGLLDAHGIEWRLPSRDAREGGMSRGAHEKVAIFRRLFHVRSDVYVLRWESAASGRSGYAPACANEWRAGICRKPRVSCSPPGGWSARASIIHRSIPWSWPCRCRGAGPCSNTRGACIGRIH